VLRGRRELRVVLGLTALALILRLTWVLVIDRDSFAFNDPLFYHHAAKQLANGEGYIDFDGSPTARWPPLYPFLISLIYRVFGQEPTYAEVFNALVGTAVIPLVYFLARSVFGRTEAVAAAAFAAVMPGLIMYTDIMLAETLFSAELLVFFLLVLKLSPRRWWAPLAIGMMIGLAAMTRSEGLLLFTVPLAVWWRELARRELLLKLAALGAGAALVIGPWSIRNYSQFDRFVLLGTNGGTTFWAGHNPRADGGPTYAPSSLLIRAGQPNEDGVVFKQEALLREEALDFMINNPLRELELIPLKLLHLNRGDSTAIDIWLNSQAPGDEPAVAHNRKIWLAVVLDFFYYALLTLTIGSVLLFGRRLWGDRVMRGVLALFVVSLVFYGFLFYGNFRYRAPLEPLMMLVAAPLLGRLWSMRGEAPPAREQAA